MHPPTALLAVFATAAAISPISTLIKCPLILSGLVPQSTSVAAFDTSSSLFNSEYVKGNSLKWSQILLLPKTSPSRFDGPERRAVGVIIDDRSIFNDQTGFRRAGLLFSGNNGSDESTRGVKTLHWSVLQDSRRGMNLSYEYLNVWHETNDYSANQMMFEAGTIIGSSAPAQDKYYWKVLGRDGKVIWSTPILKIWQNFAVTMNYETNTVRVYYSASDYPLRAVTKAISNDNSGGGQFQIGILKKPTGTSDVVRSGYQESGIHEGQIYGGLFVEDSADGCVSL